ncbi:hypothetical protein [Paenibacillus cisolokensis]|uniref:hypothetical protein n=1 Tax=Paenibacillus cisolokensis TaxID=1658519 RepID=UPI001BCB8E7E|nr:hypothetical protein [Paenibacillus cisolokensis]
MELGLLLAGIVIGNFYLVLISKNVFECRAVFIVQGAFLFTFAAFADWTVGLLIFNAIAALAMGRFGNRIYYHHAAGIISRCSSEEEVASRGGTDFWTAYVFTFLLPLIVGITVSSLVL